MNLHLIKKAPHSLFFTLSLLSVFSFMLAACSPAATTEPAAPTQAPSTEAAAPTPTEEAKPLPPITILINESPWLAGFEALVNKYVEETGNQVDLNRTPFNGMLEKSRNAVQASESEFDVLTLNEQWYMQFYAGGLVTPIKDINPNFQLDPEVIEYEWATRWDPELGYSSENGELYGLPINGNIMLFFYRKDLFEGQGLDAPQTWTDVEAAAQALMGADISGYVVRSNPPNWEFQAFLASYGSTVIKLDEQTGEWEVMLNSPEGLEALNTWLKLGREYGPANYADNGQAGRRVPYLVQLVDLFPTILDGFGIPLPAGTHGRSLLPSLLDKDMGKPLRETAAFGRYGEAMNITDGEWTLYLWPPGEPNEPLYWYSNLPPQFGDVRVKDDFDGKRYTARVTRGPMSSALYNVKEDPRQRRNRYAELPDVVRRLKASMRDFLISINAPREQLTRLGIETV